MESKNILIVGGGIGGLAAAIAFRNKGFNVDVLERSSDMHASVFGVGIIQPFNALRALDQIGCADACLDVGYSTTAWGKMLDSEGNEVKQMPGATIPGEKYPPMNGVTRPQLHEILTKKAIEVGTNIRYSSSYDTLEQGDSSVKVLFDDGSSESYDLVVGADGTYSKTRKYVVDDAIQPTYNGQSAFRINLPRRVPNGTDIDRIILQHAPEGMAGFVPIGPELAYMFYNTTWDKANRPRPEELPSVLRSLLKGFGGLTGSVRDNFIPDDAEIVLRPIEWMIAPPPWHKGRVVLLGDAAHAFLPHMGQGAAQAIEDGIVLAECVSEAPEDLEAALTRYVDRRYERCRMVIQACVDIGEWEKGRLKDFDNVATTQKIIETLVAPI